MLRLAAGLLAACALALLALPARSQGDAAPAPPSIEAQLAAVRAARDALPADDPQRAPYDALANLLVQRRAQQQRAEELDALAGELATRGHQTPAERVGAAAGETVDLARYDAVESSLDESAASVERARVALTVAREAVEAASGERAALPASEGDPQRDLAIRVADQRVALRRDLVRNAERMLTIEEARRAQREADSAWAAERVVVTDADREAVDERFDRMEASLQRRLERAEIRRREADRRFNAGSSTDPGVRAAAGAELAFRQEAVTLLTSRLAHLEAEREAAKRRLAVLAHDVSDRATLVAWLEQTRADAASLAREQRLNDVDLTELTRERAQLAETAEPGPGRTRQLRSLDGHIALHRDHREQLRAAERVHTRLAETLERTTGAATWRDRAADAAAAIERAWNYQVAVAGDSPVTLGKIVFAIGLIVFGLLAARAFARLLERRVFRGFGLDAGASHAVAELAFYALLVGVFLISLRIVNIPLTAFAFVGGALAIGVGFGSQNVVNNFISGIILLAERPIKIGDLVQVDQTYGNIQHIGLRSTRIRTGENIHVIVPNATFLETNVVNWTLNDPEVRVMVPVGVAYGSPTREVERLIREALTGNRDVLASPAPTVLFRDFGDDALLFEAHFWVRIHSLMARYRVESDIRFAIDDRFREAGIVIAYPQRDLHVDTVAPLEVRMVPPFDGETDPR